jgi:hypothetical protein
MINKILIFIVTAMIVGCAAQTRVDKRETVSTVCWEQNDSVAGLKYVLFYKQYQTTDTTWKFLSTADKALCTVTRPGFGKYVLGVASIFRDDTSEIHSSLDSTACLSGACGGECTELGAWYINWRITGPKFLRVEK